MPYYLYIVSCSDDTLYTGITNDLVKRLHAHNNLKSGAKYTSLRRPVKIVYSKKYETRKEAILREFAVKKMTRVNKLKLITSKE
jgi:putative endonuclease